MSFEDQIRAALESASTTLRQHLEADLKALAQEIARAASEDRQRSIEAAAASARAQAEAQINQYREAAQKHTEHLKHVAESQIAELRKALEDMRVQAQQQVDNARRIAQAEIEKARAEIERARVEGERGKAEIERARAEADTARAEADTARNDAAQARAEADRAVDEAAQARRQAETAQGSAEQARAEAEKARGEATAARSDAQKARLEAQNDVARVQAEIEQAKRSAAAEAEEIVIARLAAADAVSDRKTIDAVDCVRADSQQLELARAARLAEAIRNLDEARGLSEVLERLASCAGNEVDRAAVLLVKGERLVGWRLAGFGPDAPPAKSIDLTPEQGGIAGEVVATGLPMSRSADATDGPGLPPFAGHAAHVHAMALPLRVGGEVVAVLYADAPRVDAPSSDARWPAMLDVLVRHASRVLEAMTVQQAAGLSLPRPMTRSPQGTLPGPVEKASAEGEDIARRYARLLLSEIRMYHEPLVEEGRRSRDLMSRLRGEIDRARRIYEAHVPPDVSARGDYFDQELVRTLADGDRTLLGGTQ